MLRVVIFIALAPRAVIGGLSPQRAAVGGLLFRFDVGLAQYLLVGFTFLFLFQFKKLERSETD